MRTHGRCLRRSQRRKAQHTGSILCGGSMMRQARRRHVESGGEHGEDTGMQALLALRRQ